MSLTEPPPKSSSPAPLFDAPLAVPADSGWQPTAADRWRERVREANDPAKRPKAYTIAEAAASARAWWSQPKAWLHAILFVALLGGFLYQASIYWVAVIDDSYITFRFSDHLVRGFGLVFNEGGPRVEGYTNFTWMMACAAALGFGMDVMYFSKLLGLACAMGTMLVAWRFAAALREKEDLWNLLAPSILAFNSHFAHWSLMGLETQMAVLFVFWAYHRFFREMHDPRMWLLSPWLATLAAMTRIDSLYYLAPLGAYGLIRILRGHLALRRMLLWGLIAAVSFGSYFVWKVWYFGDILPNTYYAKQRLVELNTGRDRGIAHLTQFYLNQNGGDSWKPQPRRDESEPDPQFWDRVFYYVRGGPVHSFWWMNWCVFSLVALLAGFRWRTWNLLLVPIAMNTYYLYHVDGDWMPNFRFFQIVLPFWAVAGPVGLGVIFAKRKSLATALTVAGGVYLAVAAFGIAAEQARIGWVYVFGRDPMWMTRKPDWYRPEEVAKSYRGGFSAPLGPVSDWLLLNTVDGGRIFMSDIGQPLWFASHLGLYDVDGLTDKYLAHAPSVRGDLKTVSQHLADIRKERGGRVATPQDEEQMLLEARRRDFNAHLDRNALYVLRDERPEYLLIFLNHENGDVNKKGWPYPEISARVYNHPLREQNYTFLWRTGKIGNVQNTVLRRNDVPVDIPDATKVDRMRRTIERNPRFHYLLPLALREAHRMKDETAKAAMKMLVKDNLPRVAHNQAILSELISIATGQRDSEMKAYLRRFRPEEPPKTPHEYRLRAEELFQDGQREEAVKLLEEGLKLASSNDNSLHYSLAWFYEVLGRPEESARVSRLAIARQPQDVRAWQDLGSIAERATRQPGRTPEQLRQHIADAIEGFEGQKRLQGSETPKIIDEMLERLREEAARPQGS